METRIFSNKRTELKLVWIFYLAARPPYIPGAGWKPVTLNLIRGPPML